MITKKQKHCDKEKNVIILKPTPVPHTVVSQTAGDLSCSEHIMQTVRAKFHHA
jgi:hypothetical protein